MRADQTHCDQRLLGTTKAMVQCRKPPESFGSIATNSIEDGKYLNTNTGLYEIRTDF